MNERTIWSERQNHPELVVQDIVKEFNLNVQQAGKVREILLNRGVNKWLYCRIRFIDLKHDVKKLVKDTCEIGNNGEQVDYYDEFRRLRKYVLAIYEDMQNIARTPRWVEWGTHIHKKMKKNIQDIKIKGRHC